MHPQPTCGLEGIAWAASFLQPQNRRIEPIGHCRVCLTDRRGLGVGVTLHPFARMTAPTKMSTKPSGIICQCVVAARIVATIVYIGSFDPLP